MLGKVKKWFGIEGLKIAVRTEDVYLRSAGIVNGIILLQAKDAETVENIRIKVIEKYSRGRGKNKLIDEYVMADEIFRKSYSVKPNSTIEVPFEIAYAETISNMDDIERRNFFFGGIVKAAKFFKKAESTYRLEIEAQVKGTKFSPFIKEEIFFK